MDIVQRSSGTNGQVYTCGIVAQDTKSMNIISYDNKVTINNHNKE